MAGLNPASLLRQAQGYAGQAAAGYSVPLPSVRPLAFLLVLLCSIPIRFEDGEKHEHESEGRGGWGGRQSQECARALASAGAVW